MQIMRTLKWGLSVEPGGYWGRKWVAQIGPILLLIGSSTTKEDE